jgi:hypothetical protein
MLVECGFVRATAPDGRELTFSPSFGRISTLGHPEEIVSLYASLHGPNAGCDAAYILACLCDQEDPHQAVGWRDEKGWHAGVIPPHEQVILARHLMQHGIVGKAKPVKGDGKYSARFDAAEYISAARVHLGLSSADAEALSMTEFQTMLEMKYPQAADKKRDVASRDEYRQAMEQLKGAKHV